MVLYVVRHGQTDWNVENRFQGHTNTHLTKLGKQQAENLALSLKDIHLDAILSSPLQRAIDTASIINQYKHLPITIEPRLIERSFGDFEGLDDISQFGCSIHTLLNYNLNYDLHNVEPIQDLFKRVDSLLIDLEKNFSNKQILLSTHGGIVQVIESILKKLPKSTDLQSLSFSNCEYRVYDTHTHNLDYDLER